MAQLSQWLIASALGLVSGIGGSLWVAAGRAQPPARVATSAPRAEPANDDRAVEERLQAIEERLARLDRKVALATSPALPASATADGAARQAVDAPRLVDSPVFEAAVRDVMQRVDEEQTTEREARAEQRRQKTAQTWSANLTQQLALDAAQQAKVLSITREYQTRLRDFRNGDAGAELSGDQWRARVREITDASERRLSEVLTRAQMDSYQKLERNERLSGVSGR